MTVVTALSVLCEEETIGLAQVVEQTGPAVFRTTRGGGSNGGDMTPKVMAMTV